MWSQPYQPFFWVSSGQTKARHPVINQPPGGLGFVQMKNSGIFLSNPGQPLPPPCVPPPPPSLPAPSLDPLPDTLSISNAPSPLFPLHCPPGPQLLGPFLPSPFSCRTARDVFRPSLTARPVSTHVPKAPLLPAAATSHHPSAHKCSPHHTRCETCHPYPNLTNSHSHSAQRSALS